MCVYLCKVDGSARRQVVHFIECLYRPPVTRVGVGKTADRGRSELLLLLSDAVVGRPYLFVTKGRATKRRRSTTFPDVLDYCSDYATTRRPINFYLIDITIYCNPYL